MNRKQTAKDRAADAALDAAAAWMARDVPIHERAERVMEYLRVVNAELEELRTEYQRKAA